ncbi:MAG: hypothetical protein J6B33_05195 [Prevotella sp.]|nr:hypothetical protein [Prevotella sp.]
MTDKLFQNKYRIQSTRAIWHDYNCGMYFVTICTAEHKHHFGKIILENDEPKMLLSEIGMVTDECIKKMETLHNDIVVPLYQIMPNHIHLIIVVEGSPTCNKETPSPCRDDVPHRLNTTQPNNTETQPACRDDVPHRLNNQLHHTVNKNKQHISHSRGRLSNVIGGLKRAVTKYANANNIPFVWQQRFYDRIMRGQDETNRIAEYIESNLGNWQQDELLAKGC